MKNNFDESKTKVVSAPIFIQKPFFFYQLLEYMPIELVWLVFGYMTDASKDNLEIKPVFSFAQIQDFPLPWIFLPNQNWDQDEEGSDEEDSDKFDYSGVNNVLSNFIVYFSMNLKMSTQLVDIIFSYLDFGNSRDVCRARYKQKKKRGLTFDWQGMDKDQEDTVALIQQQKYPRVVREVVMKEIFLTHLGRLISGALINLILDYHDYDDNKQAEIFKEMNDFFIKFLLMYRNGKILGWGRLFFLANVALNTVYKQHYPTAEDLNNYDKLRLYTWYSTHSLASQHNGRPLDLLVTVFTSNDFFPFFVNRYLKSIRKGEENREKIEEVYKVFNNFKILIKGLCSLSSQHYIFHLTQPMASAIYAYLKLTKKSEALKSVDGEDPLCKLARALNLLEMQIRDIEFDSHGGYFITPADEKNSIRLLNFSAKAPLLERIYKYVNKNQAKSALPKEKRNRKIKKSGSPVNKSKNLVNRCIEEAKSLVGMILDTPHFSIVGKYLLLVKIRELSGQTSEASLKQKGCKNDTVNKNDEGFALLLRELAELSHQSLRRLPEVDQNIKRESSCFRNLG